MMDLQRLASVKAGPRIRGRVVFEEVSGMQGPIDPDSSDSSSGSEDGDGGEDDSLEGNKRSTALIGTPDDDQHDAAEAQTHVPTPRGSSKSSSSTREPPFKVRMGGVQGVIGEGAEGQLGGGYEPLRTLSSKAWKKPREGRSPRQVTRPPSGDSNCLECAMAEASGTPDAPAPRLRLKVSDLYKGISKIKVRIAAAAFLGLVTTALTSLIIAGGTRQLLIGSVNKSLGEMSRIDASVVEAYFGLAAVTAAWASDACGVDPGLGIAINGSVASQRYLLELLAQDLTSETAVVTNAITDDLLAAHLSGGGSVAEVGLLSASTGDCWLVYDVPLQDLVELPGQREPRIRDCEFRQSGRFQELIAASETSTLVKDPFTGELGVAVRSERYPAVVTAYANMRDVTQYLHNSVHEAFRGFTPDMGVGSLHRRRDTHEFVLVNMTPNFTQDNATDGSPRTMYYVVSDSQPISSTGRRLRESARAMRRVKTYLPKLVDADSGMLIEDVFMAAVSINGGSVGRTQFAQPMLLVIVAPSTEYLGFMPNIMVLNFCIFFAIFGAYMLVLRLGIAKPPRPHERLWRRFRCMLGYLYAWDPAQQYLPIAMMVLVLVVTTGIWRGQLDMNLANDRKEFIGHHTMAIGQFVQTFTGTSVMAPVYACSLYRQGYLSLPPDRDNLDRGDVLFSSIHRPLYPFAGVGGIHVGLETEHVIGAGWINSTYGIKAKDPTTNMSYVWFKSNPETYLRNTSEVLLAVPPYRVHTRDWYTRADPNGAMTFLPPYYFPTFLGYGVGWTRQYNYTDEEGVSQKATYAVEVLMGSISDKLSFFNRLADSNEETTDAVFIVDRDGYMVASSDKMVMTPDGHRISPGDATTPAISIAYKGITRWIREPRSWKTPTNLVVNQDGDEGPYVTSIASIQPPHSDADWLLVMAYPDRDFHRLESILIMTLILCCALGILILYVITAIFDALGPSDHAKINTSFTLLGSVDDEGPYGALLRFVLPRIHSAASYTALTFIRLSWSTMDTLELLQIDSEGNRFKSGLYRMFHSRVYRGLVCLSILTMLFLAFFEAPIHMRRSPFSSGYVDAVMISSSVALGLLMLDAAVWIYLTGLSRLVYEPQHGEILGKPDLYRLFYVIVLLTFTADLVLVRVGLYNHALLDSDAQGQVVVLLLPRTAFLRPLLLLLRFPSARHMARRFTATVVKALPVLALFLLVTLITAAASNLLFAGRVSGNLQGRGFNTFMSSFTNSFVMSSTGDNWGDIVNAITTCKAPAEARNKDGFEVPVSNSNSTLEAADDCVTPTWVYLYFIFVSLIGTIFTVSLLIQAFQEYYVSVHREYLDMVENERDVNMVAAFCSLDTDSNGTLDLEEFAILLRDMADESGLGIRVLLERRASDTAITLPTFLRLARCLEPLSWFRAYWHRRGKRYREEAAADRQPGWDTTDFVRAGSMMEAKGDIFDRLASAVFSVHVVYVLLIVNFTSIALYGYFATDKLAHMLLDVFNLLLLCYWAAEPLYPIARYGFRLFWHVDEDFYLQIMRRFVFSITVPPLLIFFITRFTTQSFLWRPWVEMGHNDISRMVLAIPLLRVLVMLPNLRRMNLGLFAVVYELNEQLFGLALLSYSFAAVGCRLFAGKLSLLKDYGGGSLNFDSMRSSIMLLYSIFISGNVTEALLGIVDTGSLIIGLLYFLLFLFFVDIIYLNLVISVVCQLYEATQRVNDTARAVKRPLTSLEFWIMFSTQMRAGVSNNMPADLNLGGPEFDVEFPKGDSCGGPVDWTVVIRLK